MQINAATAQTTTPPPVAPNTNRVISSDFETFLKMLTVQMENQDPLNPVDSADYAVQLATFSSVEQQVQTNELLKNLGSQLQMSGMAEFAAWVGREVRAPVAASFAGTPVTVVPTFATGATGAELIVRNASGVEVQRMPVALGTPSLQWAGVDANGNPFPPGQYRFDVASLNGNGVMATTPAEVYSRVNEVQVRNGVLTLLLEGGAEVPTDMVSAVRL